MKHHGHKRVTKGYNPRENEWQNESLENYPRFWQRKRKYRQSGTLYCQWNSIPHEATGESPFCLLHAFEPNCASNGVPEQELTWKHLDYYDYKYELLNSLNLAHESARELNNDYRERMKNKYHEKYNVHSKLFPRVDDRVYVKLPREKADIPSLLVIGMAYTELLRRVRTLR